MALVKMHIHQDISENKKKIDGYRKVLNGALKDVIKPIISTKLREMGLDVEKNITKESVEGAILSLSNTHRPEEKEEMKSEKIDQDVRIRKNIEREMNELSMVMKKDDEELKEKCDRKRLYEIYTENLREYRKVKEKLDNEYKEIRDKIDSNLQSIDSNIDQKIEDTKKLIEKYNSKVLIKKQLLSIVSTRSPKLLDKMVKKLEEIHGTETKISENVREIQQIKETLIPLREITKEHKSDEINARRQDIINAKQCCIKLGILEHKLDGMPKTQEELNARIQVLKDAEISKRVEPCPNCGIPLIYKMKSSNGKHLFIHNKSILDVKFSDRELKELSSPEIAKLVNEYVLSGDVLKTCVEMYNFDEKQSRDEKYWEEQETIVTNIRNSMVEYRDGITIFNRLNDEKKQSEERLSCLTNELNDIGYSKESMEQLTTELHDARVKREILKTVSEDELSIVEDNLNKESIKLEELHAKKGSQQEKENIIKSLRLELNKKRREINELIVPQEDGEIINDSDIEKVRHRNEQHRDMYNKKEEKHKTIVRLIDDENKQLSEWHAYEMEMKEYNSRMKTRDALRLEFTKMCNLEKELFYLDELRGKLRSAEVESLGFRENINDFLKGATLRLFPERNVDIQLKGERDEKEEKDKIECVVRFNGEERDILSRGESGRLVLCFCLALNHLFGSELLVLDESHVGLDEQITVKIIKYLKEISDERNGMPMIIFSPTDDREVSEKFDKIIYLKDCDILTSFSPIGNTEREGKCQAIKNDGKLCGKKATYDNNTHCGIHKKK